MTRNSLKAEEKRRFKSWYDATLLAVFLKLVMSIGAGAFLFWAGGFGFIEEAVSSWRPQGVERETSMPF